MDPGQTPADSEDKQTNKLTALFKLYKGMVMVRHLREDPVPAEILPYLFLGSIGAAMNTEYLVEKGVTHILTVAVDIRPAARDRFTTMNIAIPDTPSARLADHFDKAVAFIQSAVDNGGKVLVHCFAGRSRSTSVVLAYLMEVTPDQSLLQLLDTVCTTRPQANPNVGFLEQLHERAVTKGLPPCDLQELVERSVSVVAVNRAAARERFAKANAQPTADSGRPSAAAMLATAVGLDVAALRPQAGPAAGDAAPSGGTVADSAPSGAPASADGPAVGEGGCSGPEAST